MNTVWTHKGWFVSDPELAKYYTRLGYTLERKKRYVPEPPVIPYPRVTKRKAFLVVTTTIWNNALANAESSGNYNSFYNNSYDVQSLETATNRKSVDGTQLLVECKVKFTEYSGGATQDGADRLNTMQTNGNIVSWHYYTITEQEVLDGLTTISEYLEANEADWTVSEDQ